MAYTIEWRKFGAIKQFTGTVSFDEFMQSEREVTGNAKYTDLWFVVCNFLNANHPEMTESERIDVCSLRLGGFYTNPRIKFAFVTEDANFKNVIEKSVSDGHTLHTTLVFTVMDEAMAWATVL